MSNKAANVDFEKMAHDSFKDFLKRLPLAKRLSFKHSDRYETARLFYMYGYVSAAVESLEKGK